MDCFPQNMGDIRNMHISDYSYWWYGYRITRYIHMEIDDIGTVVIP